MLYIATPCASSWRATRCRTRCVASCIVVTHCTVMRGTPFGMQFTARTRERFRCARMCCTERLCCPMHGSTVHPVALRCTAPQFNAWQCDGAHNMNVHYTKLMRATPIKCDARAMIHCNARRHHARSHATLRCNATHGATRTTRRDHARRGATTQCPTLQLSTCCPRFLCGCVLLIHLVVHVLSR